MIFPTENGRPAWFALTVKPRHEKAASQNLSALGLEAYLPLYRVRRRWAHRRKELDLCLFPGYLFCRLPYERRLQVLNLPSVTSLVGFGKLPAPVPQWEIDAIRSILASGLPVWPWPYLKPGEKVRIERGPLTGLVGTLLRERDAWRVLVNVELLRRSVAVEIDREMLSPLHRDCRSPRPCPTLAVAAAPLLYGHAQT